MAGDLLDIYGAYDKLMNEYNRQAQQYNNIYYAGDYANLPTRPEQPIAPSGYDQYQQDQQQYTDGQPQELYQTAFGRATPDVMTNEAWSLNNISSPFMSNAPATAYETGGVAQINNPLYTLNPNALTTGQKEDVRNSTIAGLNTFY